MPKYNEIRAGKKHSTIQSTPIGAKSERNYYREYLIERDAKNTAYFFILKSGNFEAFRDFCKTYKSDNHHRDCVEYLLSNLKK